MQLYAHRGVHRRHIENTEAAFDEALRLGFRSVELDLVRLRDGHIVIFHDNTLFRMFQIDERVEDLTLDEFRRIFPELMAFDRFVERYAGSGLHINFEIKDDAETLHRIRPALEQFHAPVISSFQWNIVDEALHLGFEGGYLFSSLDQPEALLYPFQSHRFHLPFRGERDLVLPEAIQSAEDRSLYYYTVNRRADLHYLQTIPGFSGVFTDEPGLRRAPLVF